MKIRPRKFPIKASGYVRYDPDTKSYEFRTPSQVVLWPQSFRERLIRDFAYNKPCLSNPAYHSYKSIMEKETWRISGQQISFHVLYLTGNNNMKIPVTVMESDKRDKVLLLSTSSPARRCLSCYSFLSGIEIAGLPKLRFMDKAAWTTVAKNYKSR